jgi:protein-S-isoprenylcysteine O-methyltransferase Ste14
MLKERSNTMPLQVKVILFIAASAGIAWVSRASLRDFRVHGFYRFFAWEAILALFLLNVGYWFSQPFSLHQVIAWSLLIISLFLVIHGFQLLHMVSKSARERSDPALMDFERTTELVKVGAFRYIRHPLYSSLLFLAWGVFFKHPNWAGLFLAGIATFFLAMTARIEEAENLAYFGTAYETYMKQTRMFIPFLF